MQKYFDLPRIPQRIEVYDNSHNQGSYAVGAMIFYGILCTYQKFKLMGKIIFTILFVVAYAGTDELHQMFIDSRNGSLIDVGIDTLGGALGTAGCYFVERVTRMIDNKVKEELSSNSEK